MGKIAVGRSLRLLDLLLEDRADPPGRPIHQQGKPDHRVIRGFDGFQSAVGQLAAHGHVGQLRAAHQFGRPLLGRLAGHHLVGQLAVTAAVALSQML